jgi:signal transduction histidine kinase
MAEGVAKVNSFLKSVRFRLTLWYVGILTLVLVIFSGVVYLLLTNSLHSGLDDLLKARVSQVTSSYNISDGQLNLQEQDENGQLVPAEGEIGLLLNPQGQVIQKSGRLSQTDITGLMRLATTRPANSLSYFSDFDLLPYATANNAGIQLDYRILVAPVVDGDTLVGVLVLGRSRKSTEAISHNLLILLLVLAPLALLASSSGGYWLASRAMRPVKTITKTAREMSESDLSRRLNLNRNDELGELAATFDGMLMRLQAAFERQRQFTADASHELRTPLSIVRLEADQALMGSLTKEEYRSALTTIRSESNHMAQMVNDMLTLARADAGRTILKHEVIDLGEVALEVVERLKPLAEQHFISLEMVGAELPELSIEGDYSYLSQMLVNLVENAIKYTASTASRKYVAPASGLATGLSPGGLTGGIQPKSVRVAVGHSEKEGKVWAWVRVMDNGPGIAAAHLPYLFDRFYQVDPSRTQLASSEPDYEPGGLEITREPGPEPGPGGSGLGLAIVKWVVEAHQGHIIVRSPTGPGPNQGGACFEVWLPLLKDCI